MIARKTIFSFLLALLLGVGIFAWNASKRDDCDRAGAMRSQTEVPVGQSGGKDILVPCSEWIPRQPRSVQAACLVELAFVVIFALSLLLDVLRGNAHRSYWRTKQR